MAFVALTTAPSQASAQTSLAQAYPQGFALNVFDPAPAGDRFFAVPDASSFTDGRLRLALIGDYVYGTSVERTDDVTGTQRAIVSKQLYLHAAAAYPITSWLHANADLPFAAVQKGDAGANAPSSGKFGDLRLGARANVISSKTEAFALGPGVDVYVPTGSADNLTSDGRVRVNPRAVASGRVGPFFYEANGGFLFRRKIDDGSLETGNAFTFGAGAGLFLFDDVLQFGPELWGNHQVSPKWNYTKITPVSGIFGVKVHLGILAIGVAGGPGLSDAPGVAPRVIATVALAPPTHVVEMAPASLDTGNADRDHDGLVDGEDDCPDQAGVTSGVAGQNGCPEKDLAGEVAEKEPDGDGDGVVDKDDACPTDAGVASHDPKQNGCPAKPPPEVVEKPAPQTVEKPAKKVREKPVAKSVRLEESPSPGAEVTFSGFEEHDDGTSRIFVKLSGEVPVEVQVKGTRAEFLLKGATIPARNNKNPLLAQHFGSMVLSARLVPERVHVRHAHGKKKHAGDARLVVVMRRAVTPTSRFETSADGTTTFVVDFPKPSSEASMNPPEKARAKARPRTERRAHAKANRKARGVEPPPKAVPIDDP
jgi:hypothetical protein